MSECGDRGTEPVLTQVLYLVEVYTDGTRTSTIMRMPFFDELEANVKADDLERAGWNVGVIPFDRRMPGPSVNGGGGAH